AAEGHDRIGDLAAAFIDHDTFDRADPVAIAAADRGALDLVAGDQMRGLAHHDVGSNSGHCNLLVLTDCWINTSQLLLFLFFLAKIKENRRALKHVRINRWFNYLILFRHPVALPVEILQTGALSL